MNTYPEIRNGVVEVTFALQPSFALALAQFVKRVGWSEMRACAVDDDECYRIRYAIGQVQHALRDAGFAPR